MNKTRPNTFMHLETAENMAQVLGATHGKILAVAMLKTEVEKVENYRRNHSPVVATPSVEPNAAIPLEDEENTDHYLNMLLTAINILA